VTPPLAAPFPYFGGKRRAAPIIWQALGDPAGYVEPFAGSAAVLLARPGWKASGWRRTETLNDADGWLCNVWRALRDKPQETASHASGPVMEIDYHARLAWLQERRGPDLIAWLEGDPEACDAKAAGWWLYVAACAIGDPWGAAGPWHVVDGRLVKLPHLGDAGRGVQRELPHLGDAGQGVQRELPNLGDAGQGLTGYFHALAARLRSTRITCGDWARVLTPSVVRAGTGGDRSRAILLDPPYATSGDLYHHAEDGVAERVRDRCATADPALRIALCGYGTEHDELLQHGWSKVEGRSASGPGYSKDPLNGRRERIWLSPACIGHEQGTLL